MRGTAACSHMRRRGRRYDSGVSPSAAPPNRPWSSVSPCSSSAAGGCSALGVTPKPTGPIGPLSSGAFDGVRSCFRGFDGLDFFGSTGSSTGTGTTTATSALTGSGVATGSSAGAGVGASGAGVGGGSGEGAGVGAGVGGGRGAGVEGVGRCTVFVGVGAAVGAEGAG